MIQNKNERQISDMKHENNLNKIKNRVRGLKTLKMDARSPHPCSQERGSGHQNAQH